MTVISLCGIILMGDIMFKEYLKNRNISVYKLAEISNVPYTTLNELCNGKKKIGDCKIKTIESIAKALGVSIETLLNIINSGKITMATTWEDNKYKIFHFPIIVENLNYECDRIHPLMQKKINEVYNLLKKYDIIEKVILFGSSINIRCNIRSDIDLSIKFKNGHFSRINQNLISEEIQEITEYNADIVWLDTIDENSQLYKNISTMGVTIYE